MIDLKNYGFTDQYKEDVNNEGYIPARVTEVHRERYKVVCEYGECNAKLKGSLLNNMDTSEDYPAVGDFVQLRYNEMGDSQIVKVLPRKSKFSRPDYSGHAAGYVKAILEQVVAANFDYVFILASLNNDFNINRILRYITVAWESGGVPVVLLTKTDLVPEYEEELKKVQEQAIGVDVFAVSAATGEGLEQLAPLMKSGKTVVFLGSSGVGKSTLVNALAGEYIMNVNTIREDDSKGRHTTTHRQLILLKSGVMIIDTPGMRELGMWDIGEGLGETFSDVEELFDTCRFSDCTHKSEPGCAVLEAIGNGTLEHTRWRNYLQLKREAKFTEDKSAYLKEKKDFFKKINQSNKNKW
ncbi:MAG: ribosome small subunit-dependent GTPase [Herbinix sp.]|jgi:ribosome biogenesis GTPase|nr:ribosome small subunit-dependent GTPase [Herbinix sp.]